MTRHVFYNAPLRLVLQTVLAVCLCFQSVNAAGKKPESPEIATPALKGAAATGTHYMMVTAHPEATRIGAQILKAGGGAADAAIAAQLVLGLVEPQSSGIGGGAFALYYDAAAKNIYAYDGRETAPATAGKYLFNDTNGQPMEFYKAALGGRAVGVPGVPRLLETLHAAHGRMPWRDLFSPAITLSEIGFTVTPRLAALADYDAMKLKIFPAAKLYFYPDAVNALQAGERRNNPEYARVLRDIALKGADAFYTGDNAEAIVKAVREDVDNPGLMSLEDLADYKVERREAICRAYHAHRVCTMGEPSAGGLSLLIALGILDGFDLAALGPKNPQSWHLMAEASRLAIADRAYYMADPHYVPSPGKMLLDPAYLKSRAALISASAANKNVTHGTPPAWEEIKAVEEPVSAKPPGTTQIVAVDVAGNIVSMTSSVEDMFGSRMMVKGYMLNNQLTDFSFVPEVDGKMVANRVEGGKRPVSSMSPVIVFDANGAPVLAIGSAGGSAITGYLLQRIVAVIDWKQDIKAAIAAPSVLNRGQGIEMEEGAAELAEPLRTLGHPVAVKELNSGISAIQFKGASRTGAADPRREGTAIGE